MLDATVYQVRDDLFYVLLVFDEIKRLSDIAISELIRGRDIGTTLDGHVCVISVRLLLVALR